MRIEDAGKITVVGAGTMGHGIAEVAALARLSVTLNDRNDELVSKGLKAILWSLGKLSEKGLISARDAENAADLLSVEADLERAVRDADVVIEAVPERMKLKKELFARLDQAAPPEAILATNTSSLSITEIGGVTRRPELVVGMHFFNPPVMMALVEVIRGEKTSDRTMDFTVELSERFGKTPVRVEKDVHAFIVNRVNLNYGVEAMNMLSRGEATAEEIDSRMKFYEEMPMGPLELMDFGGLDVAYDFITEMGAPMPPIVEEKYRKGELGRKTGKGFYDYTKGGAQYSREAGESIDPTPFYALMVNEAAWLIDNEVCSAETVDLALKLGMAFPWSLLERADEIGLDRLLESLDQRHAELGDERYKASRLLRQMVEDGHTGKAAGQGFYSY